MSDVNVDTMSEEDPEEEPRADGTEEDAAQPPAAQRQGQEEVRCDLPPDVSLSPRPERFRSSNARGNWLTVNRGEAQAEYDSGQGDSDTGNPNGDLNDRTSSPSRLKTEMKEEVCPGGETSRKTLVPNNEAQPNQEPVDTDRNTSAVAEAIVTINVPQPNLDQADINGESAKTKGRREKKDQTGENSAEGRGTCDVNPERESRQKSTNQTDAIQTQKQALGLELSNTRDTRKESSSGTRQTRLTVAESIQRNIAADRSEKLPNKAQGREDELVSVQISTPGSHGVEGSSENLEQEQSFLDPDGPCTTPVGYLLDSTDGVQNNRTKEQIIFEMSSHPCSKMLTVYGLGAQYLGYDHWELEKMWNVQVPGCDNNVERVKHFLTALSAKGRTIHHVLLYFTQEQSKRLDIVRLIQKIHLCDCCKRILKTVEI